MGLNNSKYKNDIQLEEDNNDAIYALIHAADIRALKTHLSKTKTFDDTWIQFCLFNNKWNILEYFLLEEYCDIEDVLDHNLYTMPSMDLQHIVLQPFVENAVRVIEDRCITVKNTHPLKNIIEKHFDFFYPRLKIVIEIALQESKTNVIEFLSVVRVPDLRLPILGLDIVFFVCLDNISHRKRNNLKFHVINYYIRNKLMHFPISSLLDRAPNLLFDHFYVGEDVYRQQFCQLMKLDVVPLSLLMVGLLHEGSEHMKDFISDIREHYLDQEYLLKLTSKMHAYEHLQFHIS
jgi:hypothetical protein